MLKFSWPPAQLHRRTSQKRLTAECAKERREGRKEERGDQRIDDFLGEHLATMSDST
jgi:hypothetical protein